MSPVCSFCEIALGKAPASIVYEGANVLAFMDINPANVGHTLVVSRFHWENIYEIPEKVLAEIVVVVKNVSVAVKKTVGADGIKIIQLNGRVAGQVVMHVHFHVIPVNSTPWRMNGHHRRIKAERTELDETAHKIRKNLLDVVCGGPGRI